MKVKILGTAAATAMPLPFCGCETCRTARINGGKDLRKRSAALINDDLLIDLSPDLSAMAAMYNVDTSKIRCLLQTHSHSDHFDAGHLVTRCGEYASQNPEHLTIICSAKTLEDMNHWVQCNDPAIDLTDEFRQQDMGISFLLPEKFEQVIIGDYKITPIDSLHDPRVQAYIYLIEEHGKRLLYATDLLCISEDVWDFLCTCHPDALVIDQTYGEGCNSGGHTDAGQVKDIVLRMKKLGITDDSTRIFATHISHEGNGTHEQMEALAVKNGYNIAFDGMEFDL